MYSGWIELIHPNAPLVLQLLYTSLVGASSSPQVIAPDRAIHDLSDQLPRLSSPLLSLHPDRVIMSIGDFGRRAHQELHTHIQSQNEARIPLLWVEIPDELSEWLQRKFSSTPDKKTSSDLSKITKSRGSKPKQRKDISSSKTRRGTASSPPQLRALKMFLNHAGLMIESTLVVKSL
jgi:hypothetical protein